MPHNQSNDTEMRRRESGANLNTVIMSVGGSLITLLIIIVGYFCKGALEDIKSSMTGYSASQSTMQQDVTTIKTQLPAITQRLDKVESSQSEMWRRYGTPSATTRPTDKSP